MKFAYSEKIISDLEEYDELVKLDEEQITNFLLDWIDYKKDQGQNYCYKDFQLRYSLLGSSVYSTEQKLDTKRIVIIILDSFTWHQL